MPAALPFASVLSGRASGTVTPSTTGTNARSAVASSCVWAASRSATGTSRSATTLLAEPLSQLLRQLGGGLDVDGQRRAALHRGSVEQPAGGRHHAQHRHGGGARRLAEDRDVGGVAPERADVVLHPPKRFDAVEEPPAPEGLALGRQRGMSEEAEGAEAVVDGHDDDVAVGRQGGALVQRAGTGPAAEGAAVDPHHHGSRLPAGARRPDVERQALLVLFEVGALELGAGRLRCDGTERGGLEVTGPRGRRASGGAKRSALAYGMPRKIWTASRSVPVTAPSRRSTRGACAIVVPLVRLRAP